MKIIFRRRRLLFFIILLVASPFLLLNLGVLFLSFTEKPLADVEKIEYRQPDGTPLVAFVRKVSHTEDGQQTLGTLIFVHGTPASAAAFREQMKDSFPHYDLLAYDRPGFGQSPGGSEKANLTYQAQALAGLIQQLGPTSPQVVLVSHSYGGPIIVKTAALYPDRIAGIVLIGGSVSPAEEHPWTIQYFGDWPVVRSLLPMPIRSCNEELLRLKADLIQLQMELPQVRCPVLMLHGTADDLVPVENVDYLKFQMEQAGHSKLFQAHKFPNYTHFMLWEHADEMNPAIRDFLAHDLNLKQ